jgi:hypothetical protein
MPRWRVARALRRLATDLQDILDELRTHVVNGAATAVNAARLDASELEALADRVLVGTTSTMTRLFRSSGGLTGVLAPGGIAAKSTPCQCDVATICPVCATRPRRASCALAPSGRTCAISPARRALRMAHDARAVLSCEAEKA